MKKKRIKLTFAAILVLIAIVGGIGFWLFIKPNASVNKLKSDYSISARELYAMFNDSEADAAKKYVNAVIETYGIIAGIHENVSGNISVTLNDDMFGVACSLSEDYAQNYPERVKKLKAGDSIVVKGICAGMLNDVKLTRCIITYQPEY